MTGEKHKWGWQPWYCVGMTALTFPRPYLVSLQEAAGRVLESRKRGTENESFARELLAAFYTLCTRTGLDQLLDDYERVVPALAAQVATLDLDGGGPRNVRPKQLADSILSSLGLEVVDPGDRTIALDDTVRAEAAAVIASVVNVGFAVPRIRESVIARGRELCEPTYHSAFDKLAAHLDERGLRLEKQPKVPIDALHAVQRVLVDARNAVMADVAGAAIDRAKDVIGRANPEAAARIDQPISLRVTPRDVAILRAGDVPKQPNVIVESLLESLTMLAQLTWNKPEVAVRTYSIKETFVVGDQLEHPKFGRGSVTASAGQRIDVEFADGLHTLVHAR